MFVFLLWCIVLSLFNFPKKTKKMTQTHTKFHLNCKWIHIYFSPCFFFVFVKKRQFWQIPHCIWRNLIYESSTIAQHDAFHIGNIPWNWHFRNENERTGQFHRTTIKQVEIQSLILSCHSIWRANAHCIAMHK